LLLLLLLF